MKYPRCLWKNGEAKVLLLTESTKIKNSTGFTILQSVYPVNISEETAGKIKNIAQRISEAFQLDNCPILIQLITDGNEVNVIEFSARMGGGTKYKLIEVLSGVNIMKVYVDRVLGNFPHIECTYHINYAHLNYCYCHPGVVERLENFDRLKEEEVIYDYFQYKMPGAEVTKAETSSDRVAGYLIVADSIEELQHKERRANNELKIIQKKEKIYS